jgi:hypothetical protein
MQVDRCRATTGSGEEKGCGGIACANAQFGRCSQFINAIELEVESTSRRLLQKQTAKIGLD